MKLNRLPFFSILLFFSSTLPAQNKFSISLKNGAINPELNIRQTFVDSFNKRAVRINDKAFVVLQFETIPTDNIRKELSANGIELLEYVSGNAYTATIRGNLNAPGITQSGIRSIVELTPQQKMNDYFAKGLIPSWAVKASGTVDVWISFPGSFTVNEVLEQLKLLNIETLSLSYQSYRILSLRIAFNRLTELASLPFIEYVQPAPPQDQPLNNNSRTASRGVALNTSVADGGRGLNGEGVVIGVGDNSDIQTHIDFAGRLINRSPFTSISHGMHVSGTASGAGNVDEYYRGYASKATVVSQGFSDILSNAPAYVQDYGMVITNNSYGDIIECDYFGTYDLTSRFLDQMAFDFPNLQNVFAAGNSGTSTCAPFAKGYGTLLGGYQSAKNVLTVGATNDTGFIWNGSSRGPVKDGRVKPEVVAMGEGVISSRPTNTYSIGFGTSMAAPAVSGGLALLYQRYRQLNGNVNPKNGLMKAIVCNGAADIGTIGPDYQYGYGGLNLLRSVEMVEKKSYFIANSTNTTTNSHNVTVPANTAQLKVMLYWNDPAASLLSNKTLVNDLDLKVTDPSFAVVLPKILDTSAPNVGNVATTGVDHLNNLEQVVINNPEPGSYSLKVLGTAITQNASQEYFLVYDVIPVQLKLTSPGGGQGVVPGEQTKISWEAYGFSTGTVTIEFSADNGINWGTIVSGRDISRSFNNWTVPNVATSQALVRITKDGTGQTNTSNPFTIMSQPVISLDLIQCEGYININWTADSNITDYEVMMLQGDEMKTIGTTSGTSYTVNGLSKDSTYWVTVRPRMNGKAGRRAVAISRQPNTGTCSGTISDNDLEIDALISPKSGRMFTSTQLNASTIVSIRIKNLDDTPATNFQLKYSINGSGWVTENVLTTIPPGGSYVHNFAATADFSTTGNYAITAVVKNANSDPVTANDTLVVLVKHLDNFPLNLSSYFIDDIETAAANTYQRDTIGLDGIDRYDFTPSTAFGRARSFINTGIAYSGAKAITLDADRSYTPGNTNYLYATFNLANYNALIHDVRMDFRFLGHDQINNSSNKVWVRGTDSQPWIEIYDLNNNESSPGQYKKTESIELSDSLIKRGQNFGSSFQVRWGQYGQLQATDKLGAAGLTFDDIRLYKVVNDMQMKSIDAPATSSCGLTNASIIKVSIRNSENTSVNNVPVHYRVNNGPWVSEVIPVIGGNATVQFSFSGTSDLSVFNIYTIQAVVDLNNDSFRENDTLSLIVRNLPLVTSFPYLQNFEANDGFWFANGNRSSWEYGTPTSTKINRAASGAKAWKTRLLGNYNDNEYSYLYSPCFDLTGMTTPTLSFSIALDIEDCGAILCDAAWVEYSPDGIEWTKLATAGSGTNWYNKAAGHLWSIQNYSYWHVATAALPTGLNRLRLRFVFRSDGGVSREGIAIDDIHVYNNTRGIYNGATLTTPETQSVAGNNWTDFTSGGKLIASVQANQQNLGNTTAQVYIFNGVVRTNNNQYYHNRNITVKPATEPSDSVSIRFYFLDSETDSLVKATSCSTCLRPSSAYELGVSKYSDPDLSFENGIVSDNQQGIWSFITPDKVSIVPFDKGYYAEFKVKSFSEFWLNNGGFDRSTPLPVKLMEFTAQKTNGYDVLLKWKVGSETDVVRYEIEVARGNAQYQAAAFLKIGEQPGSGNITMTQSYSFIDNETLKSGTQYYRLKVVNSNGSFTYSPVRSVVFDETVLWQVFPNPSNGKFYFVYQLNNTENVNAKVYDAKGALVIETHSEGNGFLQKLTVDLTGKPSGLYLLKIEAAGNEKSFKLNKQ